MTSEYKYHEVNDDVPERAACVAALQLLRDTLSADVAELLAVFEHDTGLTIGGAHIQRVPSVIGQEQGQIHSVEIEVLL